MRYETYIVKNLFKRSKLFKNNEAFDGFVFAKSDEELETYDSEESDREDKTYSIALRKTGSTKQFLSSSRLLKNFLPMSNCMTRGERAYSTKLGVPAFYDFLITTNEARFCYLLGELQKEGIISSEFENGILTYFQIVDPFKESILPMVLNGDKYEAIAEAKNLQMQNHFETIWRLVLYFYRSLTPTSMLISFDESISPDCYLKEIESLVSTGGIEPATYLITYDPNKLFYVDAKKQAFEIDSDELDSIPNPGDEEIPVQLKQIINSHHHKCMLDAAELVELCEAISENNPYHHSELFELQLDLKNHLPPTDKKNKITFLKEILELATTSGQLNKDPELYGCFFLELCGESIQGMNIPGFGFNLETLLVLADRIRELNKTVLELKNKSQQTSSVVGKSAFFSMSSSSQSITKGSSAYEEVDNSVRFL